MAIDGVNNNKAYLHKITSSISTKIDSVKIIKGQAQFKGEIEIPERYLLTVENVFGGKIIILDNDSINITASKKSLTRSKTFGSPINDELHLFQEEIKKIYSKVDFLFPEMQRARLNNDALKLKEISNKMKKIDSEGVAFNLEYTSKFPDSFVSAMILNDLSKRDSIDLKQIEIVFNQFSQKVKQSVDSKELQEFLGTYK